MSFMRNRLGLLVAWHIALGISLALFALVMMLAPALAEQWIVLRLGGTALLGMGALASLLAAWQFKRRQAVARITSVLD